MISRFAWLSIGIFSLALGGVGILLPLIPTTPFVLVAAVAFAKSSNRLHQWLIEHDIFGPLIENWRRNGAISRPAKVASILSMAAIFVVSLLLAVPTHVIVIQAVVLSACAVFILTRPLPPGQ